MIVKEYGSEFSIATDRECGSTLEYEAEEWRLYGSGRDAFSALIGFARLARGWKRLFIPSYFCQEVVETFRETGIDLRIYEDSPLAADICAPVALCHGDALLVMNYFGLRTGCDWSALQKDGVEIIEDHTHDPWSPWATASHADWCLASFRKTLPLPDGACLRSPRNHLLPPVALPSETRERASLAKLAGMVLKELYLNGAGNDKSAFRKLLITGERSIAAGEISAMTAWSRELIKTFPVGRWRERRRENWDSFFRNFPKTPQVKILEPVSAECCPFSVVLVFENAELCAAASSGLIARDIYPATLWPFDEPVASLIPAAHASLGRRIMSIHCDMRHEPDDMAHIAGCLAELLEQAGARQDCP